MADTEKSVPLAISLPETLIAELDRVAADQKESRSAIMRNSIREGLEIVKAGGKPDVIYLDGELSAEADAGSKETGLTRSKILLEAIRAGLQAFLSRTMSEKLSLAQLKDPKDAERILWLIEDSYKNNYSPLAREMRQLIWERGNATTRLMDIFQHVKDARHRAKILKRYAELYKSPDDSGGGRGRGPYWMHGLSTAEMEGQIKMVEKYGPNAANWPDKEKKAHHAAVEAKEKQNPQTAPGDEAAQLVHGT